MKKLLLFLIIVISFSGCQSVLSYQSDPASYEQSQFSLKTSLKADPEKRHLDLQMEFKNKSSEKILFQYPGTELRTKDLLSSSPYDGTKIPLEVDPGQTVKVDLSFYPINDRFYYQKIGFRGDMRAEYIMPLSFIQTIKNEPLTTNKIRFLLSKTKYKSYIQKYGEEKSISIYSFSQTNETLTSLKDYYTTNHLDKLFAHHHHEGEVEEKHMEHPIAFFFAGDELILGKFSFKMVAFTYDTKLRLYFKLINRVPNLLYLNVDQLKIKIGDKEYTPLETYQPTLKELKKRLNQKNGELKDNEVYIGQNDRVEFFVEYNVKKFPEEFILDASSLESSGRDRLLGVPLRFKKN